MASIQVGSFLALAIAIAVPPQSIAVPHKLSAVTSTYRRNQLNEARHGELVILLAPLRHPMGCVPVPRRWTKRQVTASVRLVAHPPHLSTAAAHPVSEPHGEGIADRTVEMVRALSRWLKIGAAQFGCSPFRQRRSR